MYFYMIAVLDICIVSFFCTAIRGHFTHSYIIKTSARATVEP